MLKFKKELKKYQGEKLPWKKKFKTKQRELKN